MNILKFINYQLQTSRGLHLVFFFFALLNLILIINNLIFSGHLFCILIFIFIAYEFSCFQTFNQRSYKTNKDIIQENIKILEEIKRLENGQKTIEEDLNELKKDLKKGQEETIRLLNNLNQK